MSQTWVGGRSVDRLNGLGVKPGLDGQGTGLAVYRSNLGWRVREHVSWTKVFWGGRGYG